MTDKQDKMLATGFLERLEGFLAKSENLRTKADLARAMAVNTSTLAAVFNGGEPGLLLLQKLALALDVSSDALIHGAETPLPPTSTPVARQVPILSMAGCGADGWARLEASGLRAEAPKSIQGDDDSFALIARGASMHPCGIYDGYLCFCSPAKELRLNDIVCVERFTTNRSAMSLTLKKLSTIATDAYEIIGYRPLEENPSGTSRSDQHQKLFREVVPFDEIVRISVVTHIYTRPSAF